MALQIMAIRLSGGTTHEHIAQLWWSNPATGATGDNTREAIIAWMENENGKAYVEDRFGHRADVGVVKPTYGAKYLAPTQMGYGRTTCFRFPGDSPRGWGGT